MKKIVYGCLALGTWFGLGLSGIALGIARIYAEIKEGAH